VVLKELTDKATAREMFVKSLSTQPLLWCSWKELAKLCEDREMVRCGLGMCRWVRWVVVL